MLTTTFHIKDGLVAQDFLDTSGKKSMQGEFKIGDNCRVTGTNIFTSNSFNLDTTRTCIKPDHVTLVMTRGSGGLLKLKTGSAFNAAQIDYLEDSKIVQSTIVALVFDSRDGTPNIPAVNGVIGYNEL